MSAIVISYIDLVRTIQAVQWFDSLTMKAIGVKSFVGKFGV